MQMVCEVKTDRTAEDLCKFSLYRCVWSHARRGRCVLWNAQVVVDGDFHFSPNSEVYLNMGFKTWHCAAFKTLFFSSNFYFPRGVFCPVTSLKSSLECGASGWSCRGIPGEARYLQKCVGVLGVCSLVLIWQPLWWISLMFIFVTTTDFNDLTNDFNSRV